MNQIPDDIMQAARDALHEALRDPGCGIAIQMSMHTTSKAAFETAIARALMAERLAERERCAKVADEIMTTADGKFDLRVLRARKGEDNLELAAACAAGMSHAAREIADAIRGQS